MLIDTEIPELEARLAPISLPLTLLNAYATSAPI